MIICRSFLRSIRKEWFKRFDQTGSSIHAQFWNVYSSKVALSVQSERSVFTHKKVFEMAQKQKIGTEYFLVDFCYQLIQLFCYQLIQQFCCFKHVERFFSYFPNYGRLSLGNVKRTFCKQVGGFLSEILMKNSSALSRKWLLDFCTKSGAELKQRQRIVLTHLKKLKLLG